MFLGISENGIKTEVSISTDHADHCRKRKQVCLGIVNAAVLSLAATHGNPVLAAQAKKRTGRGIVPCAVDTCNGILPALKRLVKEESSDTTRTKPGSMPEETQDIPDAHQGIDHAIDPYPL